MSDRHLRPVVWTLWFVVVPVGLAALTTWALRNTEVAFLAPARWLVLDQAVPALIVFTFLFEALVWGFRHSLPGAGVLGLGGRADVPVARRRDVEAAAHLLEEAERILKRRQREVQRAVPAPEREALNAALTQLGEELSRRPFDGAAFDDAHEAAAGLVDRHLGAWRKGEVREYAESILFAVGIAVLLRILVVEAFKIPSGSMLPTLQIQDHIFVNKLAYGPAVPFTNLRLFPRLPPARGDVVVFEYPDPNPANPRQDYIKRVIALPGDVLEVDDGRPILNGWPVPRCRVGEYLVNEGEGPGSQKSDLFVEFLGEHAYLTLMVEDGFGSREGGHQGPYRVKPGEVWVLGDNRNNSSDSRAWNGYRGGGVPFQNLKGRSMFVWLSFGPDGALTPGRLFHEVMGKPALPPGAPQELTRGIERCLAERPAATEPPPPRTAPEPSAAPLP